MHSPLLCLLTIALAADPPPQPAVDPAIQQFEQQYGPVIRQLYKAELHFMRQVTRPTKQQFDQVAVAGEPALQATIRAAASSMRGQLANSDQFDPNTSIAQGLLKAAQSILSPEQAAQYQKEFAARVAARKHFAAVSLAAKMDKILVLTSEQRDKLVAVLEKSWNDSWYQMGYYTYGNTYFPTMPDAAISPLLTEAQRDVWRGVSKGNVRFGFNMGAFQRLEMAEEVWEEVAKPGAGK